MNQEIINTITHLENGGLILYPTDTVWGIGCDATNTEAVKKIYELKKRADSKALIVIVHNEKMLEDIVEVPDLAWDILELSENPTTLIYDNPKKIAKNLIAKDNSVGIRIVKEKFIYNLLNRYKKPIVSTSANISGRPTPKEFSEIEQEICKGVNYIVDLDKNKKSLKSSTIIKLTLDGQIKVIRN